MNLDDLRDRCKRAMEQYPQLKEEIVDIFLFAKSEISDGKPEHDEVILAIDKILELIEEL